MNPKKSEIIVVLDRSGSMGNCVSDTIGGFNAFLKKHKEAAKDDVLITLAQFDDHYDINYSGVDVRTAPELNAHTYVPRGMTALYDAVGRTIYEVGDRLAKTPDYNRPSKIIFVILTDGQENNSRIYSLARINDMIKHQQEKYSWQFVFLGADQNAFQGQSIGVHSQNVFTHRSADTRSVYDYMINATCAAVNDLSVQDFTSGTLNFGATMAKCAQGCSDSGTLARSLKTTTGDSVDLSQILTGTTSGSGDVTKAQDALNTALGSLQDAMKKTAQCTPTIIADPKS